MQGAFLGTFLIGLREGLEATLIVSIVGAFLKRNGHSTRPMFAGVALAVLISVGVGVGLELLSTTLPQRQQEMMETVIGAIAVVFVTSMIIWMNRNAKRLKGELERDAQRAISRGGSLALVVMAFLAVLKEGFETAVFLMAAAQTSHGTRWLALLGGAAGIALSIAVGVGLYFGGLKLNLGRFFRITGVFLVLIAAGLVLSALRTAHEAGWVSIGQQQILNFSSWMPTGSVWGALITGLFGIPTDPRLVEVLGWLLYAVPVLIVFLWPTRLAAPHTRRRLVAATGFALLTAAALLVILVPTVNTPPRALVRTVIDQLGHTATVSLTSGPQGRKLSITPDGQPPRTINLAAAGDESVDGVAVRVWQATLTPVDATSGEPSVRLAELVNMTGGRLPVGVSAGRTPGPFQARWSAKTVYTVLARGDSVVSARAVSNRTAVLSGGGLAASKTVSVGGLLTDWSTARAQDEATAAQLGADARHRAERQLWRAWLPLALAALALGCIALAGRRTELTVAVAVLVLTACSHSAPKAGGTNVVKVTMANDGGNDTCALDNTSVPAGPVTFTVVNASAPGITEVELLKDQRIIGEKENLAPGLDPVTFTVTLDGGTYQIYCPGAGPEYQTLTVTGRAPAPPTGTVPTILSQGTKEYASYIIAQIGQLTDAVKAIDVAVQAGNVDAAKTAYAKARPFYERAEASVEGFVLPGFRVEDNAGNLDYLIDMRESTPVDAKVGWKGFHAVERDLWQQNAITTETKALSAELVGNVGKLNAMVAAMQYRPEDLANGAADLIEEVQNTKITGEEEAFSHIDLVDFASNVEGAQQAYASLRPGLERIDANLVRQIDQQFQNVLKTLDGYRDPSALGGYQIYTPELRGRDAPKLTAVIQPLHQSLSLVAQKVVTAS